jgi:hypothetical protein
MNEAQKAALIRYGYDPDLPARGMTGPPEVVIDGYIHGPDGKILPGKLRNRVCYLDGIKIDGHEGSDLDPEGGCIHCDSSAEGVIEVVMTDMMRHQFEMWIARSGMKLFPIPVAEGGLPAFGVSVPQPVRHIPPPPVPAAKLTTKELLKQILDELKVMNK